MQINIQADFLEMPQCTDIHPPHKIQKIDLVLALPEEERTRRGIIF